MESVAECVIDGCVKPVRVKSTGYCGMHQMRSRRGQDMAAPPGKLFGSFPACAAPSCRKKADARQPGAVCAAHRQLMKRRGSYEMARMRAGAILTCTITGCAHAYKSSGLCNRHYVKSQVYGLSAVQLDMLYRRGACDLCGAERDVDGLRIDHDHACCRGERSCGNCLRGVLCDSCNVGLGSFSDDPVKLSAAIRYLSLVS